MYAIIPFGGQSAAARQAAYSCKTKGKQKQLTKWQAGATCERSELKQSVGESRASARGDGYVRAVAKI